MVETDFDDGFPPLVGDRIWALGGTDGGKILRSVEVLDTRMGTWQKAPPLPSPRIYAAAAVIR